jgi:cytochrome c5
MVLLMVAVACDRPASHDENDEGGDTESLSCADAPIVTYESFGRGFLATYCNGCHAAGVTNRQGAPQDVTFDDAEQASAWADRILTRALVDDEGPPMPPAGGIVPDDAERAEVWLRCWP